MRLKNTARCSSKILSILLVLAMSLCLLMSFSTAASAENLANDQVQEVSNSIFLVRAWYKDGNYKAFIGGGSSFLINESTILTCAHVVKPSSDDIATIKSKNGSYNESNIRYEVVVKGQITIEATLKKADTKDDYAILTLNEAVSTKAAVKLGNSSSVLKTQTVYALGFPGVIQASQDKSTYTKDDVTITSGSVGKLNQIGNVDLILHTSVTSPGSSGGPLVDENGVVIGLNGYRHAYEQNYAYAISINYLKETLTILDIKYTEADSDPVQNETPTEAVEETTTLAPVITEPTEAQVTQEENSSDINVTTIIICAVIGVLLIALIVIVILVISNSKKKSKKYQAPVRTNGMPTPPQQPVQNARSQPPVPPAVPSMPTMPSNEGAGETSVLNDGAGETTVLGNQSTGYFIVRRSNSEKININKPEFVIGKERRRVDYCISDNNSISRTHAKIRVRAGRCYIVDMNSTNCTYINGSKLSPNQEVILSKGDKIKLSDEEFEFIG